MFADGVCAIEYVQMRLVFLSGPLKGTSHEVRDRVTIGRDSSNAIAIADQAVSLVHCEIVLENGRAGVTDLGSTNGTQVNGQRIISSALSDGDFLAIGKSKIRVEFPNVSDVAFVESSPSRTVVGDEEASSDKRSELSGSIFGAVTYLLKRKIADGGMGAVYEAEQFGAEGFVKTVAIKTILPSFAKKEKFVSSFIGEAKLVANLVHQNIVQIHQLGRHEDGYYIAMEYIDGINITDFMAKHRKLRRRLPVELAAYIVSRVCRGLEYAHSKKGADGSPLNLVHRDVSPNNLMITREGEVKLTDFGVAKARQFMEDDEEYLVGSVEYMSPEQAECGAVDARSDIFSVGLVFYELLTGVRVFRCQGDNIEATIEQVKAASIPDPRKSVEMPESMVRILMKCLERKPDDRIQSAGQLAWLLENEIYSKGYGPTIVTLAKYVEDLYRQ